jgi:hypothetical protein
MSSPWQDVGCVRIAVQDLRVLAELRGRAGLRVSIAGDRAWVFWEAGTEPMPAVLVRRLLPLPGVELYTRRGETWYPLGRSLPAFDGPLTGETAGIPLERIVLPQPMTAIQPAGPAPSPLVLRLVRDPRNRPRAARGLLCALARLAAWAGDATSAQLSALRGAWTGGPEMGAEGHEVLVLGAPGSLPAFAEGLRFWGDDLLVPMGFRPEPDLPEPALRRAVGAGPEELVVLNGQDHERVPWAAFRGLSRAGLRLARRGDGSGPGGVGGGRMS